jgi:hypothetical protein
VNYFAVASNPNHLKIQIKMFHDLIYQLPIPQVERLAGPELHPRSLRQEPLPGLNYILDHIDKNVTTFAEVFAGIPSFGAKVLYIICWSLHVFFKDVAVDTRIDMHVYPEMIFE